MNETMNFPETFDEFAENYKITDDKQVYTNGTELIPIFRVRQWLMRPDENAKTVEQIKSEAVKEFADRLIAVSHPYADTQMVFEIQIKNLVKEMVGVNTINDNKEVKVLTHKVIRVDNLMYDGCEPHWKCTRCGKCVPFHCYTKEQFENQDCRPSFTDNSSRK